MRQLDFFDFLEIEGSSPKQRVNEAIKFVMDNPHFFSGISRYFLGSGVEMNAYEMPDKFKDLVVKIRVDSATEYVGNLEYLTWLSQSEYTDAPWAPKVYARFDVDHETEAVIMERLVPLNDTDLGMRITNPLGKEVNTVYPGVMDTLENAAFNAGFYCDMHGANVMVRRTAGKRDTLVVVDPWAQHEYKI